MALFSFKDKSCIYIPGCFSNSHLKEIVESYEKILKKLDINPTIAKNNFCCAGILENSGYEKQVRKIARDNLSDFNKQQITKIITSCPLCFYMLSQKYKEILPDWNINVEFILDLIFQKINTNPKFLKNIYPEKIVYYDSCYLARYSRYYEIPREILRIIGKEVIELPKNKDESLCCGSCGVLSLTNKELSVNITDDFIKMLKRNNITKIVTADDFAYSALKNRIKELNLENIEILHFSEIICNTLGIKI